MISELRFALVTVIFLFAAVIQAQNTSQAFCQSDHGCWFVPANCERANATLTKSPCTAHVQWRFEENLLELQMWATIDDLNDTSQGAYVALGLSRDLRMGEDTVFDCVVNRRGDARTFISFNDDLHNSQLYQASDQLIVESSISVFENAIFCNISVDFSRLGKVAMEERWKIANLSQRAWSLQLVRGYADPWRLSKKKHSLDDGSLYPWVSNEYVDIIADRRHITQMTQSVTGLSRSSTYFLATFHGLFLLWAWWFFVAVAILIARYCKPFLPAHRLFGTAVWFQLHRDFMVVSVGFQIVGVFIILWQSGFTFYVYCSHECTIEHFSKPTHTVTGLVACVLALIQPFLAWIRPSTMGRLRPAFNWLHWFIGTTAFICASVCIISAIPLGKTALARNFKKLPNFLMGAYMALFMLIAIILETIRTKSRKSLVKNVDESDASLLFLAGPSFNNLVIDDVNPKSRLFFIALFVVLAIAINSYLSYMIFVNYMQH